MALARGSMYRTPFKEPELPRTNIEAIHARSAGRVVVASGLTLAAYSLLRHYAAEPPPELADRVALAIPLALSVPLAFLSLAASRVRLPPKRLAWTLTTAEDYAAYFFVVAIPIALFVGMLWCFAPRTWSESWICTSPRPGKTVCNLAPGVSGWATAFFTLGLLPALAGVVLTFALAHGSLRALRRALGGLQLQLDADIQVPEPERPLQVELAIAGNASIDRVTVRLERTATYRQGKKSETRPFSAVTLLRADGVVSSTGAPLLLRGSGVAPSRPDAQSIGASSVGQRYVIEYETGGKVASDTIDLKEPS